MITTKLQGNPTVTADEIAQLILITSPRSQGRSINTESPHLPLGLRRCFVCLAFRFLGSVRNHREMMFCPSLASVQNPEKIVCAFREWLPPKSNVSWSATVMSFPWADMLQGPVVRKPINVNPRLKVNRGFHLAR